MVFSYYHFILPQDPIPPIKIDNKRYDFNKNEVLCINPYQKARVDISKTPVNYYAIFIDKEIMKTVTKSIYNKTEVFFNNGNYKINQYFINNRVVDYLNTYYNHDFTLDELAAVANFSPYYFIRIFKEETGKTPFEYLMDIRMRKAKELLKLNHLKVIEIADSCCYSSPAYFSTVFKKHVGFSPSGYREIKQK